MNVRPTTGSVCMRYVAPSGEVHVVAERLAHVVVARDGDGIHAEEPDGADATTRPQLGQHEVEVLPRERVDPEIDGRPCRQVRHGRHRTVPPDIGVSLPEYTSAVRGIISAAGYVPYWRLDRSQIAATFGSGGGKGTRAVASYDEDTTTMGVEAARLALKSAPGADPRALTFATAAPAYLDKTNATAIHAALRLDSDVAAFDFGGAIRSSVGALRAALRPGHPVLVVSADIRDGQPTSAEESSGGDAAAAVILGSDEDAPVIAELLGVGTATEEFIDRWRTPGDRRSKVWEERFGETKYLPLGEQAWNAALKAAELSADQVDRLIVTGPHGRAVRALAPKLGVDKDKLVDDLAATVGYTGTAHVGVLLASALEQAKPGEVIGVLSLADGADALIFRATDAIGIVEAGAHDRLADRRPQRRHVRQVPLVARRGVARRSAPARAVTDLGCGRGSQDRLEVRVRRLEGPLDRHDPRPAAARVARRRRHRRHGAGADGRRGRHDRDVHDRPDRLLAEPADRVRRRRLRQRHPVGVGALRRRRLEAGDGRPGRADVPEALHCRRHPQLLLEGPPHPRVRELVKVEEDKGVS